MTIELLEAIACDAAVHVDTHAVRQRYATVRDSFVTLEYMDGAYVMTDARTGSTHALSAQRSDCGRLFSHWQGFCAAHGVDR